jgi:hypothetical protein
LAATMPGERRRRKYGVIDCAPHHRLSRFLHCSCPTMAF